MAIILPYLDDDDDDFSFDKENNKKKERVVYLPSTSAIVTSLQQWKYILYHYNFVYTRIKHIHIVIMDIVRFFLYFFDQFQCSTLRDKLAALLRSACRCRTQLRLTRKSSLC